MNIQIRTITLFDDFDAIITIVSTVPDAKYAVDTGLTPNALATIVESLLDSIVRDGRQWYGLMAQFVGYQASKLVISSKMRHWKQLFNAPGTGRTKMLLALNPRLFVAFTSTRVVR